MVVGSGVGNCGGGGSGGGGSGEGGGGDGGGGISLTLPHLLPSLSKTGVRRRLMD